MSSFFGVAVSPFELDEWQAATGITVDLSMIFEAWSLQRSLADTFTRARTFGHTSMMVTWEPWAPTAVGIDPNTQGLVQPAWSHQSILNGNHDDYIDMMARAMRDSGLTIYLRLMHEMNGSWYPWHNDPGLFVEAWKYIRYRMRSLRNGWNIKFVWSPNPDLWRTNPADWLAKMLPYWPGPASVECVGYTVIQFGGDKDYPVAQFADRFDLTRRIFRKPVLACEMNAAKTNCMSWMADLATYVSDGTRPLPIVVLSQGASRAEATGNTGDLSWSATTWQQGATAIQGLATALHAN